MFVSCDDILKFLFVIFFCIPAFLHLLLLFILVPGWLLFSFWAIRPTTNWLMSTGMGFVLKPFEKAINKKLDDTLEDGCSEFNRATGLVRLALGQGCRPVPSLCDQADGARIRLCRLLSLSLHTHPGIAPRCADRREHA